MINYLKDINIIRSKPYLSRNSITLRDIQKSDVVTTVNLVIYSTEYKEKIDEIIDRLVKKVDH